MLDSLQGLSDINIIGLDNTTNTYHSAAEALNFSLQNIGDDELIVFVHQDIIFDKNDFNLMAETCLKEWAMVGAAGAVFGENGRHTRIVSCIQEGKDKKYDSLSHGDVCEVMTVDECVFAAHKKVLNNLRFDENTCDNWHFYAVDLSLQAQQQKIKVLVQGLNFIHNSRGHKNREYKKAEYKIVKKWKSLYPLIAYTTGWTYTNVIKYWLLRIFRDLKGRYYE